MKKMSVSLSGHQTSITLEPEFATALQKIAKAKNTNVSAIIAKIDSTRQYGTNLSSAVRVFILKNI